MKSNLESFLWISITLAVYERAGKVLIVKERLNKSASCSKMSFFKTLLGILILYGSVDLLISREERIILISSLLVGERKNGSGFSFVN